jgi:CheY-like chemotaxis protein
MANKNTKIHNVLVVDDNINTLKGISEYFETHKEHIQLDTFNDPIIALEEFKHKINTKNEYELAILDWKMPRLTGDMMSVILKELCPGIKTILYTGSSDEIFLKHMYCYKFDAIYRKKEGLPTLDFIISLLKK